MVHSRPAMDGDGESCLWSQHLEEGGDMIGSSRLSSSGNMQSLMSFWDQPGYRRPCLNTEQNKHIFSQPVITICANRLTSDQLLQEKLVAYTKMLMGPSIWTTVNLDLNRKWNAHSTPCLYCHSEACNNQVWLTLDSQESLLRVIGLKGLLVRNLESERGATGLSLRDWQLHQSKGASVILKYKNHRSGVGSFLKQNLSF